MKLYKVQRWLKHGGCQIVLAFAATEPDAMRIVTDKFGESEDWEVMSAHKPDRAEWVFNCILR